MRTGEAGGGDRAAAAQHSVHSPDGRLIATIYESQRLIIRSSSARGTILRNFALPQDVNNINNSNNNNTSPWPFIQWSRCRGEDHNTTTRSSTNKKPGPLLPSKVQQTNTSQSQGIPPARILLANDHTVLVWGVDDDSRGHSVITGRAAGGNLRMAHVCFGYTADEVLLFSVSGIKVTIWSLVTNRAVVEIRDPKSLPTTTTATCYDFRPRTGHLAILTRASAHDTLMLLAPKKYELLHSVDLTTVDAQGVKWSADGRWLAIWEASSMGFKVLIHTADGHLFKTYTGGQDADNIGLGVRVLKWSPTGNFLAIGDCNQRAVLLATNNLFSPTITFEHPTKIDDPIIHSSSVWEEQIINASITPHNYYLRLSQPTCPPTPTTMNADNNSAPASASPYTGVSIIEWNADGTLLATRDDSTTPSTAWIWSSPRSVPTATPIAVLIHHSPIKRMQWHPVRAELLLIQCCSSSLLLIDPVLHIWCAAWEAPKVIRLPLEKKKKWGGTSTKFEANWLLPPNGDDDDDDDDDGADLSTLKFGDAHNYIIARLGPDGEIMEASPRKPEITGVGPEDVFDEGASSLD